MRTRARSLGVAGVLAVLLAAALTLPAQAVAERRAAPVQITGSNTAFSPNGDGSKDVGTVSYQLSRSGRVTVTIGMGGKRVLAKQLGRQSKGTKVFRWNGKRAGTAVADGRYTVTISTRGAKVRTPLVVDARYDKAPLDRGSVRLSSDTVYPSTTVIDDVVVAVFFATGSVFAPADSRYGGVERIRGEVIDTTGRVVAPAKTTIFSTGIFYGAECGTTWCPRMTWDGRLANGKIAPLGTYRIRPVVPDAAGNPRILATSLPTVLVSATKLVERTTTTTTTAAATPTGFTNVDPTTQPNDVPPECGPSASARYTGGFSFSTVVVNSSPTYPNYPCRAYRDFSGPQPERRTPYDSFRVTATGGPQTVGSAATGSMKVGDGAAVTLSGDGSGAATSLLRANTEVPGKDDPTAVSWYVISNTQEPYDVATFTYTLTEFVPAD